MTYFVHPGGVKFAADINPAAQPNRETANPIIAFS